MYNSDKKTLKRLSHNPSTTAFLLTFPRILLLLSNYHHQFKPHITHTPTSITPELKIPHIKIRISCRSSDREKTHNTLPAPKISNPRPARTSSTIPTPTKKKGKKKRNRQPKQAPARAVGTPQVCSLSLSLSLPLQHSTYIHVGICIYISEPLALEKRDARALGAGACRQRRRRRGRVVGTLRAHVRANDLGRVREKSQRAYTRLRACICVRGSLSLSVYYMYVT